MQPEVIKILGLGALVLALFIGSLFCYIAHLKRVAPAPRAAGPDFFGEDAKRRFAKLDMWANSVFVLLTLCFGVCFYLVLVPLLSWRASFLPPAELSFPISRWFAGIVAGFSGAGLGLYASMPVMMHLCSNDARWYATYVAVRRYGCDYSRLCRGLGTALVLLALLAVPLGLNFYVQVRSDSFVIHDFFAVDERTFSFSDIQSIETAPMFVAPNGRRRNDRNYIVHFKSGEKWISNSVPSGNGYDGKLVAELLSKKSGVVIKEIPIFSTSDLYD